MSEEERDEGAARGRRRGCRTALISSASDLEDRPYPIGRLSPLRASAISRRTRLAAAAGQSGQYRRPWSGSTSSVPYLGRVLIRTCDSRAAVIVHDGRPAPPRLGVRQTRPRSKRPRRRRPECSGQHDSTAARLSAWQHGHTPSGQRSSGAAGMPAGQLGSWSARQRGSAAAQQASGQHARTHARTHARKHAPMHSTAARQRASGAAKQRGSTVAVQHGSLALYFSAAVQRQGRWLMRDFGCEGFSLP